jgi:hypothetical protein
VRPPTSDCVKGRCLSSIRESLAIRGLNGVFHRLGWWIAISISASELHVMIGAAMGQASSAKAIFPPSRTELSTCLPVVSTTTTWLIAVVAMPDTGNTVRTMQLGTVLGDGGVVDAVPEPFRMHYPGFRIDGLMMHRWVSECCDVCYHVLNRHTLGLSSGPHSCITYTCCLSHKASGKL